MKQQTKTEMDALDYLLGVINDPNAEPVRKDRLALAALPYCRPKIGDRMTKKEERERRVRKVAAGDGHGWRGDILGVQTRTAR